MVEAQVEEIRRVPMSWEEFRALPDDQRAEWVDGVALLMSPVNQRHGVVVGRLTRILGNALPACEVGPEIGLELPRNRVRAPDLMVIESETEGAWRTEPPPLVVEVVSASTRTEDTLRKPTEYAEGGVGQRLGTAVGLRTGHRRPQGTQSACE